LPFAVPAEKVDTLYLDIIATVEAKPKSKTQAHRHSSSSSSSAAASSSTQTSQSKSVSDEETMLVFVLLGSSCKNPETKKYEAANGMPLVYKWADREVADRRALVVMDIDHTKTLDYVFKDEAVHSKKPGPLTFSRDVMQKIWNGNSEASVRLTDQEGEREYTEMSMHDLKSITIFKLVDYLPPEALKLIHVVVVYIMDKKDTEGEEEEEMVAF
jgi:hypothetical protein